MTATQPAQSAATPNLVRPGQARTTAQAWLNDGRILEAPVGMPLENYIQAAGADQPWVSPVLAALIDGELRELTYRVEKDVEVIPVTAADWDGSRIYRRSLTFLLLVAVHELMPPTVKIHVNHSVTFGGYYCEVQGRPNFTPEELAALEGRMHELVTADLHIAKQRVPLGEAIAMFRRRGDEDKVKLLAYRRKDYLTLYTLRAFSNYFHGYMVPSTGYLPYFALTYYPPGFILRFPPRTRNELDPVVEYPKLITVFHEYHETLRLLGVENVGELNGAIEAGRKNEIILVAEALHEQRIAEIASQIAERRGQVKLVLMAGPSSSGKTTFAKRLAVQLLANGMRPIPIGLDDFFVDRELSPRDAEGNLDFEVLEAVDLKRFNQDLLQLMSGQVVQLPRFNFVSGKREPGRTIQLGPDHVLLVEGIHGLNPRSRAARAPRSYLSHLYLGVDAAQHRPP